ncbi:MAG: hypothetical protein HC875_31550 [Anaerolineales bacterium]|nr:hypothetical protein [Anaerolineales bacterium]
MEPRRQTIGFGLWRSIYYHWDVATDQPVLTLEGHTNGIYLVAWSPDGKQLASASADQTIIIGMQRLGDKWMSYAATLMRLSVSPGILMVGS